MKTPRKCLKKRRCFRQSAAYFLMCCLFFSMPLSVIQAGPKGKGIARGNPHVNNIPHANPHSADALGPAIGSVNPAGVIVGTGGIKVTEVGSVANQGVLLIGQNVTNTGTLTVPKGHFVMAAGDTLLLGQPGSNVVVQIDYSVPNGYVITALTNKGKSHTSGGQIVLAAGDVFSNAIANLGSLSASLPVPDPIGAKGPNPVHGGTHPNKGDGNPGGGNGNGHWGEGNKGNGVGNIWTGNQGHGVGEGMAGGRKSGPPDDPPEPPDDDDEIYMPAAPLPKEPELTTGGCPALMEWLAQELGIPTEELQVYVANALASPTNIQPCAACVSLKDAAAILQDAEDTRITALAKVIDEFVTGPAPPSEEQMTSIAMAFAEHAGDDTHYASAGEWIDALAQYVTILNTELGYSAGDSINYAEQYVAPVGETGNENLIAYVEVCLALAALGG